MRKRLFIADVNDLISIVEDSANAVHQDLPIEAEDIANYWVNDLLRTSGKLPVGNIRRYLDVPETYCTLTALESAEFKRLLFHTIDKIDTGDLGVPTMQHCIENGTLEFFILRG